MIHLQAGRFAKIGLSITMLAISLNGCGGKPVGESSAPTSAVLPIVTAEQKSKFCVALFTVEGFAPRMGGGKEGAIADVRRLASVRGGNAIRILSTRQSTVTSNHYATAEALKCELPE